MKTIFTILALVMSTLSLKAQIINFPDPDFKYYLTHYPSFVSGAVPIDSNGDGEIQESEAYNYGFTLAGQALKINNRTNITDLTGINYFTTINYLQCYGNNLGSLDVSNLNLIELHCSNNANLSSLVLSNPLLLKYVWAEHCNLQSLDLTGYTVMRELSLNDNALTSIDVSVCPVLQYLYVSTNQLTSLDVRNLPLSSVQANQNQLSQLLFSPNAAFNLHVNQNRLTNLDINGTNIHTLECQNNLFTALNFYNCPNLFTLKCDYNQYLNYLNLKDDHDLVGLNLSSFSFCPNLHYVCADQVEVAPLLAYFTQNAMPNIIVDAYCSFVPGTNNIYSISGSIRFDGANNGCTSSDPLITYTPVKIYDVAQQTETYSSYPNGGYFFFAASGNYTITPLISSTYFNINPAPPAAVNISAANPNQVTNFCLTANGIHPDLEVVLIPTSEATPGFAATYQLVYTNKGTQTLSGDVQLSFNDSRLDFASANPVVTTQLTNSLSWTYASLTPLESRTINISFNVLAPPVNNGGDTLAFTSTISPIAGDEVPGDNSFATNQIVTGSFDPNDKTCLEGKFIDITRIGDYLHYVIRFQNTGTGNAYNVLLKDILSTKYNWSSLKIIKASHPLLFKQKNGNDAEFFFPNINLTPKTVNEAGSHGFVAFKIRIANTVTIQDSLINKASIYFDFNAPIITNDALTVFENAGPVPVSIEYFKGQKQNVGNALTWKANCTGSETYFEIERSNNTAFISIGSMKVNSDRCLQAFEFIDTKPQNGLNSYRIKLRDVNGKISYSNVVVLLNKNTGIEILSLSPNPVTDLASSLNIVAANAGNLNITVIDMVGRPVFKKWKAIPAGVSQVILDFASLPKGIYLLSANTDEGERKVLRFVKQ